MVDNQRDRDLKLAGNSIRMSTNAEIAQMIKSRGASGNLDPLESLKGLRSVAEKAGISSFLSSTGAQSDSDQLHSSIMSPRRKE